MHIATFKNFAQIAIVLFSDIFKYYYRFYNCTSAFNKRRT